MIHGDSKHKVSSVAVMVCDCYIGSVRENAGQDVVFRGFSHKGMLRMSFWGIALTYRGKIV
jgi:hypothetical protein